ncbi:MAG: CNP1-like family protein [Rhodocyclales bacterium]|nr:CNP1-like family protein [Rhodocyclales bacterium]
MHEGKAFLLGAGLLVLAGQAAGQQFYGDKKYGEFYEEDKKWTELEAKLPDYPKEQNLIEFNAGAATSNRYYVDGSTLSIGGDGVVRYVVVVRTHGGAINVNFEGIRCGAKERKLYAFGRSDSTWGKSRTQEWQSIRPGSYQAVLSKEYFCPGTIVINKTEEGVDALRRGGHPESR